MTTTQRNFLILGLIAVAGLLFTGAFNVGAGELEATLNLLFSLAMIGFFIVIFYRNSGTIGQMATQPRLVMYGACGLLFFLLTVGMLPPSIPLAHVPLPYPVGFSRFGGSWTLFFWGGIFASAFGIWWSWQQRTSKW